MNIVCDNCIVMRGIKYFNCQKCGKKAANYMNGLDICDSCCQKEGICKVCGKKVDVVAMYKKLLNKKMEKLETKFEDEESMANDLLDMAMDIIGIQSNIIERLERKE